MAPDDDPIPRLARLMRLVLGATTDGEHLAALAAFRRAMEAAGLDLHDIVGRFESSGTAGDVDEAPAAASSAAWSRSDVFEAAIEVAARHSDDLWPSLAQWLCDQDDAWHAAHRRWLLNGNQRRFAEDQRETALSIRPTLRQAAWLIALFDKVTDHLTRPDQQPLQVIGQAPRAGDRVYAQRTLPAPRPRRQPRRVIGRKDQVDWICAVISARRQGASPVDDRAEPALFADAEVRVLAWLASDYNAWIIDRSARGKEDIVVRHARSAAAMASAAQVSLRTVRRALAKAIAAGYLELERRGSGRGKPSAYRLTLPPERLRHDRIPPTQPRRQTGSGNRRTAAAEGHIPARGG
jgi:hypothetical protein